MKLQYTVGSFISPFNSCLELKGAYTKTGVCAGQPKLLHREVSDPLAHRFHTKKISSEDSYFCNRAFPGWNAFFGKN